MIKGLSMLDFGGLKTPFQLKQKLPIKNLNLLLVGDQDSGVTNFLHLLNKSLDRRTQFLAGEALVGKSPYKLFAHYFDGYSWKLDGRDVDEAEEYFEDPAIFDGEVDVAVEDVFEGIFPDLDRPILESVYTLPKIMLSLSVDKQIEKQIEILDDLDYHERQNVSEAYWIAKEAYLEGLSRYIKAHKIPPEIMFGYLAHVENGTFGIVESEFSVWRYIKMTGTVPEKKVVQYRRGKQQIVTGCTDIDNFSKGERNKVVLDQLVKSKGSLALLEDPLQGIALKSQSEYLDRLVTLRSSQVVATTVSDLELIARAQSHPNWRVYDTEEP